MCSCISEGRQSLQKLPLDTTPLVSWPCHAMPVAMATVSIFLLVDRGGPDRCKVVCLPACLWYRECGLGAVRAFGAVVRRQA